MESFSAIIDRLGVAETAAALGLPLSHVRTLKARDSIPPGYFKRLVDDARERRIEGITFDLLYRLHEEKLSERGRERHGAAEQQSLS